MMAAKIPSANAQAQRCRVTMAESRSQNMGVCGAETSRLLSSRNGRSRLEFEGAGIDPLRLPRRSGVRDDDIGVELVIGRASPPAFADQLRFPVRNADALVFIVAHPLA